MKTKIIIAILLVSFLFATVLFLIFLRPFLDIQEAKMVSTKVGTLVENEIQESTPNVCGASTFVSTTTKRTSICLMLPTMAKEPIKSLELNGSTYCRDENSRFPTKEIQREVCDKHPKEIHVTFGK